MILANEAVGALLAGRQRETLFRVHERPDPQSIELLLAKLEALEVPTPPRPERLSADEAARLAARVERARGRVHRPVADEARKRFRRSSCARSSRRATTRAIWPLRPRQPGVLPLHLPDSPLPGPRLPPVAPARARAGRRSRPGGARGARGVDLACASARPPRSSTGPTRSAWRGCSSGSSSCRAGMQSSTERSLARSARVSSFASTRSSRATCPRGACRATTSSSTRSAVSLVGRRAGHAYRLGRRNRCSRRPGRKDEWTRVSVELA